MTKKKPKEEHKPSGRPTDYKEEYNQQAYKLCLLGAKDTELANFFEVSEVTINAWKQKHPTFLKSLREGKQVADAQVANRLYNRACGFKATDTKFATHEGLITDSQEYIKEYPPDTTAAIFWLKNRQPDKWRDRQEVQATNTNINVEITPDDIKKQNEEIDKIINDLKNN